MHPRVNDTYQELAQKYEMKGPFLEVGVGHALNAILSGSYFLGKPQRFATNLSDMAVVDEPDDDKIQFIRCNANNMRDSFADGQFGTVLCNAMIEHDKYFWRSLDEMKRVLAPGGILAIGAPGYVARKYLDDDIISEELPKATITFDVHSKPDYWRFSRTAFKEVICEGLEILETCVVLRVPILVAVARKPLGGLLEPVTQEGQGQKSHEEEEVKWQTRRVKARDRSSPETPEERQQRHQRARAKRDARLLNYQTKPAGEVLSETSEGGTSGRPATRRKGKRLGAKSVKDDNAAED
jgi:SAM-dependent methyltransferase